MKMQAVMFRWKKVNVLRDGGEIVSADVMVPHKRFANVCGRQFVHDEDYPLMQVEERSQASHNHYFAALGEAYKNLPEQTAKRFTNLENFRHWCLIQTGWCTETDFPEDSPSKAKRLAAFFRGISPYMVIKISGSTVKTFVAVSQSRHAMKKQAFEDSKRDVLELAAEMAGITRAALQKHADTVFPRNAHKRETA